jgi:hypothetical protein
MQEVMSRAPYDVWNADETESRQSRGRKAEKEKEEEGMHYA